MTVAHVWRLFGAFFLANGFGLTFCQESPETSLKLLTQNLLKNYSSNVRPVWHHGNTTLVHFSFEPVHIDAVDEVGGILKMDAMAIMSWEDQHLTWDPQKYNGIKYVHLKSGSVWKPDISVYNSRSFLNRPWFDADVSVSNVGKITWFPPSTLFLICDQFNYDEYPYDKQKCSLDLGSWMSDKNEIDYEIKDKTSFDYYYPTSNANWKLLSCNGRKENYMDENNETQVMLIYDMELKRINVSHKYLGSVPDIVARVLILCMFWIPDLTRKLCLGCVSLVMLTLIIANVNQILPSPAAAPAALAEHTAAMALCTAAIILEIIVFYVSMLSVASPVFVDRLSQISFLKTLSSRTTGPNHLIEDNDERQEETASKIQFSKWVLFAIFIEKSAFIVFAVLLLAV